MGSDRERSIKTYRYILRYLIDPGFHAEDRIEELAAFCVASGIKEVLLFHHAEELTPGHPTAEQRRPWIEMAKRLKTRLERDGVELSMHSWTTTHHVPRGRRLFPGQSFTTMVSPAGVASELSACPLCPEWQAYICESFAEWARELHPRVIWIEDDWRLHNHGPELGYGGCFCDLHLQRFAQSVGRDTVGREELVEALTAPGPPHPWRGPWLDLCRASLLEPAHRIRAAVRAANPGVRMALMTSDPDMHSVEGRDWHAMQEAWGFEPEFLVRPHLPPYTETNAIHDVPAVTRHTIANLKRPIGIFPELENGPRCGLFSKSHRFTAWECLHSVCYGAPGITINEFDMMGNGTALDPDFGSWMTELKLRLSAVADLAVDDARAEGVRVLFHPDIARQRCCRAQDAPVATGPSANPVAAADGTENAPAGLFQLKENSREWSRVFYTLGIAHGFTCAAYPTSGPTAVSGQTLRAFADEEVEALLRGTVLLDAEAAEVLLERGFGPMIGIAEGSWQRLNDVGFAYESLREEDPAVYGLSRPRMTAQRSGPRLFAMSVLEGADVRSDICRWDHRPLWPGLVVFENAQGGRVATLAYTLGKGQFYMSFFNVFRLKLIQNLLFELAPDAPLAAARPGPIHVYRAPTAQGLLLALLNPTHDTIAQTELRLGGPEPARLEKAEKLDANGRWNAFPLHSRSEDGARVLTVKEAVAPLDALFLRVPTY